MSEQQNTDNKSEKRKPYTARGKIVTVISAAVILAIAAFIAFSTVSDLKEKKQNNEKSGYTAFEYAKDIKLRYTSTQECVIDNNTYYLMNDFRAGYVIENKGRYNKYGFFFGDTPDFHMMKYDSGNVEFWYMNALFKYPDIQKDKVVSLIIPDAKTYKTYGNSRNELVRIDFGEKPVTLTDTDLINTAVSEYTENKSYSCSLSGVPEGTPVYAKFENSCLYFLLGYTAEE